MDHNGIVVLQSGAHHGPHSPSELQYRVRERASVTRPFRVMELKQSSGFFFFLRHIVTIISRERVDRTRRLDVPAGQLM